MVKSSFFALMCFVFVVSVIPAFAGNSSTTTSNAYQGQEQGQNQAMGGQSNTQIFAPVFEGSKPQKNSVHVAPNISFPGLVADITGPADHFGPNFTRMIDLLKYKSGKIGEPAIFTREELEMIVEATETFLWFGEEPKVKLRCFGGGSLEKTDRIAVTFLPLIFKKDGTVEFAGDQSNFEPRGYFQAIAATDDHLSLDILAVALVQAMDKGINAVDIMSEGSNRELYSSGWGIGSNISGANINDLPGSAVSGVVGGGTGWSASKSGFNQLPWIQGHLGYRNDM